MGLCTKGAKKRYGVIDRTSATVWRFVHRRLSKVIYLLHTFHYLGCIANKVNYRTCGPSLHLGCTRYANLRCTNLCTFFHVVHQRCKTFERIFFCMRCIRCKGARKRCMCTEGHVHLWCKRRQCNGLEVSGAKRQTNKRQIVHTAPWVQSLMPSIRCTICRVPCPLCNTSKV